MYIQDRRNNSIFRYKRESITRELLDNLFLPIKSTLSEIKSTKMTIPLLVTISKELSNFSNIIDIGKGGHTIQLKEDIKVGAFEKGYKDYKNYVRYMSIIVHINFILKAFILQQSDVYYDIINTPRSSNRIYDRSYKYDDYINPYTRNFHNLEEIDKQMHRDKKISPKYSTYFAEN